MTVLGDAFPHTMLERQARLCRNDDCWREGSSKPVVKLARFFSLTLLAMSPGLRAAGSSGVLSAAADCGSAFTLLIILLSRHRCSRAVTQVVELLSVYYS